MISDIILSTLLTITNPTSVGEVVLSDEGINTQQIGKKRGARINKKRGIRVNDNQKIELFSLERAGKKRGKRI